MIGRQLPALSALIKKKGGKKGKIEEESMTCIRARGALKSGQCFLTSVQSLGNFMHNWVVALPHISSDPISHFALADVGLTFL